MLGLALADAVMINEEADDNCADDDGGQNIPETILCPGLRQTELGTGHTKDLLEIPFAEVGGDFEVDFRAARTFVFAPNAVDIAESVGLDLR